MSEETEIAHRVDEQHSLLLLTNFPATDGSSSTLDSSVQVEGNPNMELNTAKSESVKYPDLLRKRENSLELLQSKTLDSVLGNPEETAALQLEDGLVLLKPKDGVGVMYFSPANPMRDLNMFLGSRVRCDLQKFLILGVNDYIATPSNL
jgi:hypothetical protein